MWKLKSLFLVFCLVGLCTANAAKSKTTSSSSKQKDVKEKRDVVTPTPYSYEVPQKSFQSPIHVQQHHTQQKYTQVVESQHAAPQKVAPLEYPKEDISQAVNEQSAQYHPTTFHTQSSYAPSSYAPSSYSQASYTPDFEALYSQSLKNFDTQYQHFDSFNHLPVVHYNGDYDKINSAIVAIPGYAVKAAPVMSNIKAIPSYVYAAPASTYNYPSYAYPSQSYVHSYPQAVAAPSHQHYTHSHGFAQSPSTIFIPQAISIAPSKVPSKVPDYATSSKGLSHYSSVSAAAPLNSYYSHSHPQTERPFKPSQYLGSPASSAHIGDSYTEQSIGPSKTYLPAKEHSYSSHQHVPQVEYHVQYVQQPSKSYLPAKEHHHYTQSIAPISSSYLPAKEQYAQHVAPVSNTYLPAKEHYTQHVAPVSNNYLPPHKVVHVEQPKSSYLPPVAAPSKTYLAAKIETPSNVYLPSKIEKPTNIYLPAKVEKPSTSYLPPNNPYHHHSAPSAHQYSSHEYESAEYQAVASHSGHK